MSNRSSALASAHVVSSVAPARVSHRHVDLDGGDAFLPDYRHGVAAPKDDEVEAMGEEFIVSATSAESIAEAARDEEAPDELDGLHVETIVEEEDEP